MQRRHPAVVNLSEATPNTVQKGTKFGFTSRSLGRDAGGLRIGCTHYVVEPGRTAYPHHYHCVNDEAIYVLAGEGTLRIGEQRVPVRGGDWINLATGPEHAHQLLNTGGVPLEYLCMSTTASAEVVGYPDSNKLGVMAAPSVERARKGELWKRAIIRDGNNVDYYDGEDTGE